MGRRRGMPMYRGSRRLLPGGETGTLAAYRELLSDPGHAERLGARARERVLDEHTYAHRARQLLAALGLGAPVSVA